MQKDLENTLNKMKPKTKTKLKKKIQQKRLKAWVSAGSPSENYGFGSNWSLNIGTNGKAKKSMWLGQGAKVTSRMLGTDYGDYVKDVAKRVGAKKQFGSEKEWLSNKKINKEVTEDVIHSAFGDERIQQGDTSGWTGTVDNKRLKKLLGTEDWGLSVQ